MLLSGRTEVLKEKRESFHLEQASQAKIDTFPSPRVLSSHLFFEELPREVIERKLKIIYLIRDPKDCLVSWYTCTTKVRKTYTPNWYISFPDWLKLCNSSKLSWGNWFENIESWERALEGHPELSIHLVHFEDLKKDPVREIQKMNDFLDVGRDLEFCKKVADKTQFETMKADNENYTERFGGEAVHYNKGVVGNWKTMFTVAMMEEFDQLYERKMAESRFRDRYSQKSG